MITIKSFEVNYFSENTYLLYDDTKEAVLIDCGCPVNLYYSLSLNLGT